MDDKNRDAENRERLKRFESSLDPAVAPFLPKKPVDDLPTMAVLVQQLRTHAKGILELCDQADLAINSSEGDARKAADALMEFMKRVK